MADNVATRTRVCVTCSEEYTGPTRRGKCNACRNRESYHEDVVASRHKANRRAAYLKHKYGLNREQYSEMLDKQGGVCAICRGDQPGAGKQRFHVDHDHSCCDGSKSCGECVRGLLCHKCNVAISLFQDDPEILMSAIAYVGGGSHR